jgi:uncharacterized RDD family membrane protein YckC
MKAFLLSPFKNRLAVSAAVSFVLVLSLFALTTVLSIDGWRQAEKEFKKWNSGQGDRCERLFSNAESELAAIDKGRCDFKGEFAAYAECKDSDKRRRAALVEAVSRSDCPSYHLSGYGDLPVLVPKGDPGSLVEYAFESKGLHLPVIPVGFAALTILLVLLTDVARRVLAESHVGWKRLSLVASVLAGLGTLAWWLHDGEYMEESAVAGLVALAATGLSLIYGKVVFAWVAAGFGGGQTPAPSVQPSQFPVSPKNPTVPPAVEAAPITEAVVEPAPAPAAMEPVLVAADFWPRFWARCLDLPLCWLGGSVAGMFLPDIRSSVEGPSGVVLDVLAGMVFICGFAFLYEAFFLSRFGATPGKMLFGISVESVDGGLPSWEFSKRRAWVYLKSGLYFTLFLPVMQIFGAIAAWRRRDGSQPWDMAARTFVRQRPVGMLRFGVAVVLSFCLVSFMVGASKVMKESSKEDIRRSVLR